MLKMRLAAAFAILLLPAFAAAQAPTTPDQTGVATPRPRLPLFRTAKQAAQPQAATATDGVSQPVVPGPSEAQAQQAATGGTQQARDTASRAERDPKQPARVKAVAKEKTPAKADKTEPERPRREQVKSPVDDKSPELKQVQRTLDEATSAVTEFIDFSNQCLYSRAAAYLTPPVQRYLDSDAAVSRGGLKGVLDEMTREGEIRRRELSVTVRGEGARAEVDLTFAGGEKIHRTFHLIRLDDNWRIILNPAVHGGSASGAASPPAQPVAAAPTPSPTATPAPVTPTPAPPPPANTPNAPLPEPQKTSGAAAPSSSQSPQAAEKPAATPAGADTGKPAPSSAASEKKADAKSTTKSALSDAPWQMQVSPGEIIKAKP